VVDDHEEGGAPAQKIQEVRKTGVDGSKEQRVA